MIDASYSSEQEDTVVTFRKTSEKEVQCPKFFRRRGVKFIGCFAFNPNKPRASRV